MINDGRLNKQAGNQGIQGIAINIHGKSTLDLGQSFVALDTLLWLYVDVCKQKFRYIYLDAK